MSTTSPPPDSSPVAVPPTSTSSSPLQPLSLPVSPTSLPNANPPETKPSTSSPSPQSPPPTPPAPPPVVISSPPPDSPVITPPPPTPPPISPPHPPSTNSTPPAPLAKPPESPPPPPPPPSSNPTVTPPLATPPEASPPSPTSKSPPVNTPSPPSSNPTTVKSPPPPTPSLTPPQKPSLAPPPSLTPPQKPSLAPPPASKPPLNTPPPPPTSKPRKNPLPPPEANPPEISVPPPVTSPPPPALNPSSPPPLNSTSKLSPLPTRKSPPSPPPLSPPSFSLSPPSPTQTSISPSGPLTGNNSAISGVVIAIIIGIGFLALSLIALLVWCITKRNKKASPLNGGYIMPPQFRSPPKSDSSIIEANFSAPLIRTGSESDGGGLGNSRPFITYERLFTATNGFSDQNLLGEGGFGCVYKGILPDGREVAVKQLKICGVQGEREFKTEVEMISRIHHRHLVSLVGYCIDDNRRLLVYEYVPNDTLYYHLHGEGMPVLDWARRVKIAASAARGIAYLHEDCHPRIIHRDIKSSNILLDANFDARVSDFGLAKLAVDTDSHVSTRVMGTFGYMAPEYAASGKLTEKSDVYSFGVVLLELITGRKPVDSSQPLGDESLVEWARPLLSDAIKSEQFDGLADPRLGKNYVETEMIQMIEAAAAACVRHSASNRPRMGQIARALDSNSSDLTNGMRPGQSEIYDSAQQSAEIRLFQRMAFGNQNYSTDYFNHNS